MSNIEQYKSALPFSHAVQRVRTWEDRHLPLSQSRIAFDLFMLIASSAETGRPLTLKEIFNSLRYSERGIRYVLDQFIDGGWCNINEHGSDKRFRLVVASELMMTKLKDYEAHVLATYATWTEKDQYSFVLDESGSTL